MATATKLRERTPTGLWRKLRDWPKNLQITGKYKFRAKISKFLTQTIFRHKFSGKYIFVQNFAKFPNFSPKPFSDPNFPKNMFLYRISRNFRISRQNCFPAQIFRKTCSCTEFREISEFHGIFEKCLSEPKFTCFSTGLKTCRAAYVYISCT